MYYIAWTCFKVTNRMFFIAVAISTDHYEIKYENSASSQLFCCLKCFIISHKLCVCVCVCVSVRVPLSEGVVVGVGVVCVCVCVCVC